MRLAVVAANPGISALPAVTRTSKPGHALVTTGFDGITSCLVTLRADPASSLKRTNKKVIMDFCTFRYLSLFLPSTQKSFSLHGSWLEN